MPTLAKPKRDSDNPPLATAIGTLNESPLHAALKQYYTQPGDLLEVNVDGYVIDILRGDLIIEIQTANFASVARKMRALVEDHHVRLVYPAPQARWIVRLSDKGLPESRRKSPKRAGFEDIFAELVSFPDLIAHPNFEIEVLLTHEDEFRRFDARRRWRRKGWTTVGRQLLDVTDSRVSQSPDDLLDFLPPDLPDPFHTADLAAALKRDRFFARKVAYCLRGCGAIHETGKQGNAILYSRTAPSG